MFAGRNGTDTGVTAASPEDTVLFEEFGKGGPDADFRSGSDGSQPRSKLQ